MLIFTQNTSTTITIGPILTSAGIISSGMTTAASIVYQNGGAATTLSMTSVVYKTGGIYQIDLSSNAVANIGRVFVNVVSNVGYNGGGPIYGGVLLAANANLFYGTSALANVLSSVNWQETTRLLTSAAVVWSASSRDLSTYAGLSSAVWAESSRLLTSGAVVWSASSRDLSTYAGLSSAVWQETSRLLTSAAVISSQVWAYTSRDLSTYAGLSSAVWTQPTTRTLTSWGGASTFTASDVWSVAARLLTSGQAAADAVWANTTRSLTSWGGASTFVASDVWASVTRTLTSGAVVWNQLVESTLTYEMAMKGLTAVVLGESTGGGTTAIKFRNFPASTADRISYTVTTVGNRLPTTYSW